MFQQRTISQPVGTTGIGLHSGQRVEITFRPAPPNTGIVFTRVDHAPPVVLPANPLLVRDTRLSTCLVDDKQVKVGTIEHLMSAAAGLGIDNLYVDLDASEVPILDGSAASFIFLLRQAGIVQQNEPKHFIRILRAVEVSEADKWARLVPHDGFQVAFEIDFDHPAFDKSHQFYQFDLATQLYAKDIARARTFGFMQDVETLYSMGLAQGGSMDNAIVLDEHHVLNPGGLRYADEFVRHKILDSIGDLYLLGHPIIGRLEAYKSSHALNNALARAVLAQKDAWELIDCVSPEGPEACRLSWFPAVEC